MTSKIHAHICRGMVALAALAMVSCSSVSKGPGGQITKVKYNHLIPNERLVARDRSILFERQYLLYGAVSRAEQMERAGSYYAFNWEVTDRSQPVTVHFEYRQTKSGLEVRSMDTEVDEVHRSNWTKFEVTGAAYRADGPVTAWRVSIRRGKEELASQQSYLWE